MTAFPDEPLRVVVYRMAETGFTQMPVVERQDSRKVVGIVSLADLLQARARDLEQEHRRQRVLKLSLPFVGRSAFILACRAGIKTGNSRAFVRPSRRSEAGFRLSEHWPKKEGRHL